MKKIGAELIILGIASSIGFFTWIVISIYSTSALAERADSKATRAIALEAKIDYIYQYLIERNKK